MFNILRDGLSQFTYPRLSRLVRPKVQLIEVPKPSFGIGGYFDCEIWTPEGELQWRECVKNGVTDEGLNHVLNVELGATSKVSTWYMGLVIATPTFAAADTLASHAGWTEFTSYSGNRVSWTASAGISTAKSIGNSTSLTFTCSASGTLAGAFLCSVASGTSGILWATGSFSSNQSVVNGTAFKASYTCTASAS